MNTLFASRPDKVLPRFEDLTMDVKGSQREPGNRPDVLTNRDIEAEILAQLARRGFDWSGKRRRHRRDSMPSQ